VGILCAFETGVLQNSYFGISSQVFQGCQIGRFSANAALFLGRRRVNILSGALAPVGAKAIFQALSSAFSGNPSFAAGKHHIRPEIGCFHVDQRASISMVSLVHQAAPPSGGTTESFFFN